MNESEQAQAIAVIKTRHIEADECIELYGLDDHEVSSHSDRRVLLEIVDSQAQKIDHQQAELSVTKTMLNDMNEISAAQAKELAEARAIAEKMRDRSERPGGGHAFLPWEKQ